MGHGKASPRAIPAQRPKPRLHAQRPVFRCPYDDEHKEVGHASKESCWNKNWIALGDSRRRPAEADSYIQAVQLLAKRIRWKHCAHVVQAVFCDALRVPLRQKTELMQLLAEIEIIETKSWLLQKQPQQH
jgi:hypothetical protein